VIIINEVTQEQAGRLDRQIRGLSPDPARLTLAQLKQVLAYAHEELGLGDMYNSDRAFIAENMTPATADAAGASRIEGYGLMKRDARDLCYAIYVPGRFVFDGPAASPQVFGDGGVIVRQGDEYRGVQPEVSAPRISATR
jgi:hypothetical protein